MSEELIVEYKLERDFIKKNSIDQNISGVLSIYPNPNRFKNNIVTNNDLIFLLDTSSSMDEKFYKSGSTKRDILIQTMNNIVKLLNPKDTISIISFNSNATVYANHLSGGAVGKIKQAIEKLKNDNGATNFEAAMKTAEIVSKNSENSNTKIIFLTDGESVSGNDKNAIETANKLAKNGITMDAMGIGSDFDFDYMKQYTELSNGLTENITDEKKARIIFTDIVKNAREVVIKKIFMNFMFSKSIRDLEFYQISPEQRILNNKIFKDKDGTYVQLNVGDLEKSSQKEFLFVANLNTGDDDSIKISEALLNYDTPLFDLKNQEEKRLIYLNLSDDLNDESFDSTVSNYRKELQLLTEYELVKELNNQNKPIEAIRKLENMVKISEDIGNVNKKNTYSKYISILMKNNKLTQEDLNEISSVSSRTSLVSIREKNNTINNENDFF